MTETELQEWAEDFEAFHARFAPIFGRKEPREQAQKYVRGLLAPVERKNSWMVMIYTTPTSAELTSRMEKAELANPYTQDTSTFIPENQIRAGVMDLV